MRAARFYGAGDVRVDDLEPSPVGPTDVRIDVAACGICGTDIHEYEHAEYTPEAPHPRSGASRPITIGHEFSGTVSKVGDDVTGIEVGAPVAVHPNIPCDECRYCEDGAYNRCADVLAVGLQTGAGGFAEEAVVPAGQVHRLPMDVSVWKGALVEPLAVGLHAVRRSELRAGDTAAVFGCGPIGLTVIRALDEAGAKRIFASEPNPARREVALELGADATVDPTESNAVEQITTATDGGVDASFEFAGVAPAVNAAIESTRRGGCVTVGSMTSGTTSVDLQGIVTGERTLRGTYCYGFPPRSFWTEFDAVIESLGDGGIEADTFVTRRVGLDALVEDGIEELRSPDTGHVKILVEP
ncbi:2,3-butanediol dehydrogenase [Haloarcula sp. S1AR25-5A]|uniref:2,3-butanediol dehydrogenase n=1 Tax=Haloarcula terrestris TaxID=2950533 RepID=A0AAE4JI83_9EURY|nr:2,3-butanediol dehydrogenase [Haloarcula terrestris]MDS0223578.1 2,3-butanediol dehydrogenase [Haloarcula terrestris]